MSKRSQVTCNPRGLTAKIEQTGERAIKHVTEVMRDYAELILEDAIANAPHDTGSLESALKIETDREGINRRLRIRIIVDESTPYAAQGDSGSDKVVGDYAWLMEKFLLPHGIGGGGRGGASMHAREGTRAKGPQAGGRFLLRAVNEHKAALIARAELVAKRAARSKV